MNQQDRFGNIHYLKTYYYLDANDLNQDGNAQLKSSKSFTPDEAARVGGVQVKRLLIKERRLRRRQRQYRKANGLS
jgi:hypothetical protein